MLIGGKSFEGFPLEIRKKGRMSEIPISMCNRCPSKQQEERTVLERGNKVTFFKWGGQMLVIIITLKFDYNQARCPVFLPSLSSCIRKIMVLD
jgi:hypothetical protein